MHPRHRCLAMIAAALVVAACVERAPTTPTAPGPSYARTGGSDATSYILDFVGTSLPTGLAAQVAAAGGALTASMDKIGVAVAASSDPAFPTRAAKISGVYGVAPDPFVRWIDPTQEAFEVEADAAAPVPGPGPEAAVGASETFRLSQWAPDAVHAPAAWGTGAQGAGVRVAIVDGGIYDAHIDIAPSLDVAHSRSFVPGQPYNFDQARDAQGHCVLSDFFWHGTHVAGIVAAPANSRGTVGIAPSATIIGVKVLHCGSGFFSWIINGIYYAATPIAEGGAGAQVINMSLGATFDRQGAGAALLAHVLGKATTYAYQRGVTVVAALGNAAIDLDHTNNLVSLPAMSPHVIAVSATGPLGFGLGATNFDRPASYTDFGQSAVDFAGPGGDFALPLSAGTCSKPRIGGGPPVEFLCRVFDLVVAPCRGTGTMTTLYCWAAGTSMATPAVSGVAALIIGRFGPISPAEVLARLRASADDLGKPGNDDFYGGGRVNAERAVR